MTSYIHRYLTSAAIQSTSIFGRKLNTLKAVSTVVGTTAVKIELPETADIVKIYHLGAGVLVYLGENNSITPVASNVIAIPDKYELVLEVTKGNDNSIYAVVSAGTTTVYAYAMVKE